MRISACRICRLLVGFSLLSVSLTIVSLSHFKADQLYTKHNLFKRNNEEVLPNESQKQVVESVNRFHRKTKGIVENFKERGMTKLKSSEANVLKVEGVQLSRKTELNDIFIALKTTKKNEDERLKLLMDTWIDMAKDQTYIFTDSDQLAPANFPADHFFPTNCSGTHYRSGLCCKMNREYDAFMSSNKRWFCHVDDDNYVNVPALVKFLQNYSHNETWYLGRPSISHPIEVQDRANPGLKLAFWFATGGAGFCISRRLAELMKPEAAGGRIQTAGDFIRLPDDCTVGYIINHVLKVPLTKVDLFHSHLEGLHRIPHFQLSSQLTFSYSASNVVKVDGYSPDEDPTRFRTIHCRLYPSLKQCIDMPR